MQTITITIPHFRLEHAIILYTVSSYMWFSLILKFNKKNIEDPCNTYWPPEGICFFFWIISPLAFPVFLCALLLFKLLVIPVKIFELMTGLSMKGY